MFEKAISDSLTGTVKLAETAIRETWSMMDAAAEKKPPSEQVSPTAIRAIQGIAPATHA